MLTGWTKPFKVNRPLSSEERRAALPQRRQPGVRPDPYLGLIHFNSTYADFIDRSFALRGMSHTALGSAGIIFYVGLCVWLVVRFPVVRADPFVAMFLPFSVLLFLGVTWYFHYRKEFFAYTHYPIRFNRKTGNVHVFRHNGPGGVLTISFDQVFWHVGRGNQQKYLCDVRGHVLDGDMVRDTFAVGNFYADIELNRIRSIWEFIYRYMKEGPETVVEHPLDRFVHESPRPTWHNCYVHAQSSLGFTFNALRRVLFFVFYPTVWVLTLTRWLALNSSKEPVWPPEVEAESRIEPNDPHRWEEPTYLGEFGETRPGVIERHQERMQEDERLRVKERW